MAASRLPQSKERHGGQEGKAYAILRSVGLEAYAAYSSVWSQLGLMGALKLGESLRKKGTLGSSLERLIFLVTDTNVAHSW